MKKDLIDILAPGSIHESSKITHIIEQPVKYRLIQETQFNKKLKRKRFRTTVLKNCSQNNPARSKPCDFLILVSRDTLRSVT